MKTLNEHRKYWLATLCLGLVMITYRLVALSLEQPGFFFDEAYYYGWSLTPDWGYYSKPPMVAWSIWLSTHLLGISEFTTKLPAAIYYFITGYVVQLTTVRLANPKAGFWAFTAFMLMPIVSLNSWFITTDAPLFLFWSLTTYFYLRAEETDKVRYWVLAGIFGGLGLLSKYTMILLPASLFIMYIVTGDYKKLIAWKFWLTILVALVTFSPNIIWQFANGFPSFIHTAELANKPGWDGNPLEFMVGQLIVAGPIALVILLSTLKSSYRLAFKSVWHLTWVPLFIFCLKSIQGEAFINWAAFAYVSGCILIGVAISNINTKIKAAHIVVSLILALGFYHYPSLQKALNIEPTKHNTAYSRVDGWRELTQQLVQISNDYPTAYIVSESRTVNSYLNFYLPDPTQKIRTINRDGHISNQYELFYVLQNNERPVLWVSDRELNNLPIKNQPGKNHLVSHLSEKVYPSFSRNLWVYLIE